MLIVAVMDRRYLLLRLLLLLVLMLLLLLLLLLSHPVRCSHSVGPVVFVIVVVLCLMFVVVDSVVSKCTQCLESVEFWLSG